MALHESDTQYKEMREGRNNYYESDGAKAG